jgi:hypothetical protein
VKCRHCENDLPKLRGWATETTPGKIACQLPGCLSFGLKSGSIAFHIQVAGRTAEQVQASWKARIAKGVQTQRDKGFYDDKSNNPYSAAYWIKHGLTPEEAKIKLKSKGKRSSQTKRDAGFYDDKSNNPYSTEFGVKQGLTAEEAALRIRRKNHNCAEFWEVRGYSTAEAEQKAKESAGTNSLPSKIARHGEQEGTKRYTETRAKLSDSWSPSSAIGRRFGSSKQANVLFLRLYRIVRRLGYMRDDVMCKLNRGELYLRDGPSIMFYDFCLKPLKLIIEFNGEHVHPNKQLLSGEAWGRWKHAFSKKSADEVLQFDEHKVYIAEQSGYNVLTIWSKDPDNFNQAATFIRKHHERKDHQA